MTFSLSDKDTSMKKTISISLALCLCTTQATAGLSTSQKADYPIESGFFKELGVSSLEDSTHGLKVYDDANGMRTASYGGSLVMTRKKSNTPQWFHFQSPEIQASCSGLSFKGMFGTIVNWNEIQQQLEEAGSSFAWGVLVGIIYSLPGIGEIFSKLDAWAKKIQAMLADACNGGINAGRSLGEGAKSYANDKVNSWFADDTARAKEVGKDAGNYSDKLTGILDCDPKITKEMGTGFLCSNSKEEVKSDLLLANFSFPSVMGGVLSEYQKTYNLFPVALSDKNKIKTFDWTDNGDIATGVTDEFYQSAALAALISSATGDIRPADELANELHKSLQNIADAQGNQQDKTKIKQGLDDVTKAVKNYQDPDSRCSIDRKNINSVDSVITFLLDGKGGTYVSSDENDKTPVTYDKVIQKVKFPVLYIVNVSGSSSSKGKYAILPSGLYMDSNEVMSNITKFYTDWQGINPTAKKMVQCYLHDTNCSNLSKTLISAPSAKYMAKVYRNTKSEAEKAGLEEQLIYYLKATLFNVIKDSINHYTSLYSSGIGLNSPSSGSIGATGNTTTKENIAAIDSDTAKASSTVQGAGMTFAGCSKDAKELAVIFSESLDKKSEGYKDKTMFLLFSEVFEQDKRNNAAALGEFKK